MKRLICMVLVIAMMATGMMAFAENNGPREGMGGGPNGERGGGRMGGGQTDKSSDTELQAMIAEVAPKFQLLTYEDEETGTALQYQLYVPESYDESESYPLIQFIPDASVVGRDADYVLTQGWGGLIWATDEEQAKHPAFVVVPVFTETIVDDMFVGSQWDNSILNVLEDDSFFYIVSAGDPKASVGQAGLMEVFDGDGAAYSHAEWSAQDDAETQNAAVAAMLAEGNSANFVTFTLGTTLAEGQTSGGGAGEHMTSFDYAYKIEAVRDWLFGQVKA